MSERYPGGFITKNAPQPTGGEDGVADGIWTLEQALEYKQAGTWPIPVQPVYVEDVFSTWLYTGNGSTQTITNGINLSGKGGLVWAKSRSAGNSHILTDTVRGVANTLATNWTGAQNSLESNALSSFNSNGFGLNNSPRINVNAESNVSWTFREQPKFFDIVTFTQSGTSGYQTINHNLGSVPGVIIIKGVGQADGWFVYHRSIPTQVTYLNQTNAAANFTLSNSVTSTTFNFNLTDFGFGNGATYVAYLFAHDAGGFGDSGSDNVITCGSYTGTGSAQTLSLGYEPQWVLIKQSSGANAWNIWDNMRGLVVGGTDAYLQPNTSNAENSLGAYDFLSPTATGLTIDPTSAGLNYVNTNGATYIYIAIRRGPMKVPTTGTSVFAPYVTNTVAASSSGSTSGSALYRSDFVTDFVIQTRKAFADSRYAVSRLTGDQYLVTNSTAAEATSTVPWDSNIAALNFTTDYGQWMFRRAPGFFDVVCYTANSVNGRTINHNLTVAPEFAIFKSRSATSQWYIWHNSFTLSQEIYFNTSAIQSGGIFTSAPTSSAIFASSGNINFSGFGNVVAYLFATVAGVSKVGSYTGTGALQTVNCGFTGGARFVLIKRTDSTGDWWVYDSARGITSGNDPYLFLNSTAAEVTGTNYVDTTSVGFQVTAAAPAGLNANGGTYIFLAIA